MIENEGTFESVMDWMRGYSLIYSERCRLVYQLVHLISTTEGRERDVLSLQLKGHLLEQFTPEELARLLPRIRERMPVQEDVWL